MIKKINRIKEVASYKDYEGNAISEFNRFNILYGENGSGKTVLSKLISLFSEVEDPMIKEDIYSNLFSDKSIVEVVYNDIPVKLKEINFPKEKVYVFNSLFVSNYLHDGNTTNAKRFKTSDSVVARIESPEIKRLKDKNNELISEIGETDKTGIRKGINELTYKIESSSQMIREEWNSKAVLKGKNIVKPENNFVEKPRTISQIQKEIDRYLKELELMQRDDYSVDMEALKIISKSMLSLDLNDIIDDINKEIHTVAKKNVVEKIQSYINHKTIENAQTWFDNGMRILVSQKDNNNYRCPLCNSILDYVLDDLIADYQGYFDETREILNKKLDVHLKVVDKIITDLENRDEIVLNSLVSKYQDVVEEELKEITMPEIDELKNQLTNIKCEINKKKNDYNYSSEVTVQEFQNRLKLYNQTIENFNQTKEIINRYFLKRISSTKIDTLIRNLYYEKFSSLVIKNTKVSNPIAELNELKTIKMKKEKEKDENLTKINTEIIKMQVESENINAYLLKLNITKFKVSLEDKLSVVYTEGITKNSLKHSLSEGEKTTLAFAYFLSKMAYEVGKDNYKDYIVYLDDPISSIDEDRMFNTANLIYEEFEEIKQLFISSHSFKFLRIMNNFMKFYNRSLKSEKRNLNSYKIRDNQGSEILNLPDDIAFFTTLYYSKLQLIIKYITNEDISEDEKKSIPNSVRIVFESYLSFKFGYLKGDKYGITPGMKELFEAVKKEDDSVFSNLAEVDGINKDNWKDELDYIFIHYTNMFSHGNPSSVENDEPPTTDSELMKFCKSTISIIKFLDGIHYKLALVNCVNAI